MAKHYPRVPESAFADDIKPMVVDHARVTLEIEGLRDEGDGRFSLEADIAEVQREHVVAVFGLDDSPIDVAFTDYLMEMHYKHSIAKTLIARIK